MSTINHTYYTGQRSVGVIDFNATGEAAMAVVIGGVTYLEADAEDLPNGIWTNGGDAGARPRANALSSPSASRWSAQR